MVTFGRCSNLRVCEARSNLVPRRLDAFIPEIDFGLAAMVGYVNVHGEQDFSSEEASVGRVVGRAQLLFGEVGLPRACAQNGIDLPPIFSLALSAIFQRLVPL